MKQSNQIIGLLVLTLFLFGCTDRNGPTDQVTQPAGLKSDAPVSPNQNQTAVIEDQNNTNPILTGQTTPAVQPESLSFEVRQGKIFDTGSGTPTEITEIVPRCFDNACYATVSYSGLAGKKIPVSITYVDSNGISMENPTSIDGEVAIAYVKGPIRKENCFVLSEEQYQKYLTKKSIGSYCLRVNEMEKISGLKFSDEFALIVGRLGSNIGGLYVGGNVFLIDSFWLNASKVWVTLNHEQVHSALRGYHLPLWFEEGVADYLADAANKEGGIYKAPIQGDITQWDPVNNTLTPGENSNHYIYSSWLVKVLQRDKGSDSLSRALTNYKKYGVGYSFSLDIKNKKLEEALQEALQDPLFTLEKYAYPY